MSPIIKTALSAGVQALLLAGAESLNKKLNPPPEPLPQKTAPKKRKKVAK